MVLYAAIYLVSKLTGISSNKIRNLVGFPWWSSASNSPSNAGASGLIPGQGTKNLINSKLMENLINSKPVHCNYQTGAHEGPYSTIRNLCCNWRRACLLQWRSSSCKKDPAQIQKKKTGILESFTNKEYISKNPFKARTKIKTWGPAKLQVRSWAGDISSKCRSYLPGQQQLERASQVTSGIKIQELCSIPELGRSPGGGNSNPPQYSCLKNPMDRGLWQATVYEVTKSQILLSRQATGTRLVSLTSL